MQPLSFRSAVLLPLVSSFRQDRLAILGKNQLRNNLCVIASHQLSQLLRRRSNRGLIEQAQFFSCLVCSNKQRYKHLSRTRRSGQNRHRDEVFPAVLPQCELHHLCFVTNSQGEGCS